MLELKLKKSPRPFLEVTNLTPDKLMSLTVAQIEKLPIIQGNESCLVGDLISVTGDPSDGHQVWSGDLVKVVGIGHEMRSGWIQIEGHCGNHLGSRMLGGTIHVKGNAGDYVGAEMTGGLLHISGDAGNHLGAAYDGGQNGQNGGAILIDGNAGHFVGKGMRRGLIAIGKDAGHQCGFGMKAGTILVCGSCGSDIGQEMIRGTIVLQQASKSPLAGFQSAGIQPAPILNILAIYLKNLGFGRTLSTDNNYELHHGDCLRGSRGELFIATPAGTD